MLNKEEFKKMIDGKIRPNYVKDADYQTNAPSFYEYLARNNELLQLLAERIWGYDEEINAYFERWENNLATINEDVIQMMIKWFEDGTLDDILNNELLNFKPEIYLSEDEPITNFKNTYWYHDVGLSGLQSNIYKSNVAVSNEQPDDENYNVWLNYNKEGE